ncbi:MAG: CGGC domain-containing protein [Deltaproteobacteria bacterium]|nr:CGGC domain-containing protein [Deltaproteobacteria bacterium]
MDRCPLTNCFKCLAEKKEGFAIYEDCMPAVVFTCRCPGDNVVEAGENLWNAIKNRILYHVIVAMSRVHVRESAVNA